MQNHHEHSVKDRVKNTVKDRVKDSVKGMVKDSVKDNYKDRDKLAFRTGLWTALRAWFGQR